MPGQPLEPGTYYVDEVDGTPTPRIFVTIGTGWTNSDHGSGLDKHGGSGFSPEDDVGFITFSRPDRVYLDACQWDAPRTRAADIRTSAPMSSTRCL